MNWFSESVSCVVKVDNQTHLQPSSLARMKRIKINCIQKNLCICNFMLWWDAICFFLIWFNDQRKFSSRHSHFWRLKATESLVIICAIHENEQNWVSVMASLFFPIQCKFNWNQPAFSSFDDFFLLLLFFSAFDSIGVLAFAHHHHWCCFCLSPSITRILYHTHIHCAYRKGGRFPLFTLYCWLFLYLKM